MPREAPLDDFPEFLGGADVRYFGAESAGAGQSLRIAASILAHQDRPLLLAKPFRNPLEVMQQAKPLLFERRVCRNRIATQRGLNLSKEPGASQTSACDHHSVNGKLLEGRDNGLGRVQIAVAN